MEGGGGGGGIINHYWRSLNVLPFPVRKVQGAAFPFSRVLIIPTIHHR